MKTMIIRQATVDDMETIMRIYGYARRFMAAHGNPSQWSDGYPSRELIMSEIRNSHCFVCSDPEGRTVGMFCFIIGEDPTYRIIEQGSWINGERYGTIHRLASDGTAGGVAMACIEWCQSQIGNLRIDTHADNTVMQRILGKAGFRRCGIIHTDDGSPRIAYQKV